jgi:hypothetical protein
MYLRLKPWHPESCHPQPNSLKHIYLLNAVVQGDFAESMHFMLLAAALFFVALLCWLYEA